jgi:Rrf2 family iron-sulfur cluster assembly transcriptional regulator
MLRDKALSYAVSAMIDLAEHASNDGSRERTATEIAQRHNLPVSYAAKVLSQLARASLLRSGRGPQGGYALARGAEQITLLDIVRAVGAFDHGGSVPVSPALPEGIQSRLDRAFEEATARAGAVLAQMTLQSLVGHHPFELRRVDVVPESVPA